MPLPRGINYTETNLPSAGGTAAVKIQHARRDTVKKLIWIVLPILIVGVVLVSVFEVLRNNLALEVTRLQTENEELNRHLD